jgi:hypothetical protein
MKHGQQNIKFILVSYHNHHHDHHLHRAFKYLDLKARYGLHVTIQKPLYGRPVLLLAAGIYISKQPAISWN